MLFVALPPSIWSDAADWRVIGMRRCMDAGLRLIALLFLAIRRPCTLQSARERVAPAHWHHSTEAAILVRSELRCRLGILVIVAPRSAR